ncbi:MAG: SET family sugar efflux transporter-like MFS transporter, partial [Phenylobacterium sp.]
MNKSAVFILTCLFCGLSSAFIFPLLSLYLIEELQISAAQMGGFLAILVIVSVLVSTYIGKISDQGVNRQRLILISQTAYILATLVLAFNRDFILAMVLVTLFLSVST